MRTVDAGSERIVIAPNFMAVTLVEVFEGVTPGSAGLVREYAKAGSAAVSAMLAGMSDLEQLQYMLRAARRHQDEEP